MIGTITATVQLKVRFWVNPYLSAVKLFCLTFNTEPDYKKLTEFIARRGIKVTAS